jgi:hypothetical protein
MGISAVSQGHHKAEVREETAPRAHQSRTSAGTTVARSKPFS